MKQENEKISNVLLIISIFLSIFLYFKYNNIDKKITKIEKGVISLGASQVNKKHQKTKGANEKILFQDERNCTKLGLYYCLHNDSKKKFKLISIKNGYKLLMLNENDEPLVNKDEVTLYFKNKGLYWLIKSRNDEVTITEGEFDIIKCEHSIITKVSSVIFNKKMQLILCN